MPAILIKLTAAAALTIAAANPAFAHAHLSQSMPRAGTTVSPPTEIVLTFTERIERAFSNVEVYDSSGKRVEAGKAQVKDNLIRLPLKPLPAGAYEIRWHVLSVDTHRSQGSFKFTVKP